MKMTSSNWGGGIPMGKDFVKINFMRSSEHGEPELRKVDTLTFTKQVASSKPRK